MPVMIKIITILIVFCLIVSIPCYGEKPGDCPEKGGDGKNIISFPSEIKGLKRGEVSTYEGDRLYLLINGEAETFEQYGYLNMQVVSYEGENSVIQVQVSKMPDNLTGFGIFSFYTDKHGKFVEIGSNGFQDDHSINFYKGRYFVQVQHLKGNISGNVMENVSREICKILPDKSLKPVEVDYFPAENLIKYTVRFIPRHFMGYSFLPPAFEAYYQDEKGGSFRVFILTAESEEKLKESIDRMKEKVKDVIMTEMLENKAVGAVGFKDKEKAKALIKQVLKRIEEQKGKAPN